MVRDRRSREDLGPGVLVSAGHAATLVGHLKQFRVLEEPKPTSRRARRGCRPKIRDHDLNRIDGPRTRMKTIATINAATIQAMLREIETGLAGACSPPRTNWVSHSKPEVPPRDAAA